MLKKYVVLSLAALMMNLSISASTLAMPKEKDTEIAEKVKTEIIKLGVGTDSKIEVKLKDGKKIKGYLSRINENSFIVANEKTTASNEVPYRAVKQLKGNNHSKEARIAIGVGIAVGIIVVLGLIFRNRGN